MRKAFWRLLRLIGIGLLVVLGRSAIALRIAPHPLLNADKKIDLPRNPIIRDDRLPALGQAGLLGFGPLLAVIIAPAFLGLSLFGLLIGLEGTEFPALVGKPHIGRRGGCSSYALQDCSSV